MRNDSVGKKNTKMKEEIKMLKDELTDKCEEGSSGNTDTKVKEEIEIKKENYSFSDTIRRLAAGCEGTTNDFKVKKEVKVGESSTGIYFGKKMGVCGGLWFNTGDAFSHVWEYQRWKRAMKELALEHH